MCAVPKTGLSMAIQAVEEALQTKLNGSSVHFNSLIVRLSKNDDENLADLLHALSRYTVLLSEPENPRSPLLRPLVDAAVRFNFTVHAHNDDNLSAFHFFILNLISASSTYVEPVIVMLVTTISKMNYNAKVHQHFHAIFKKLLHVYPQSSSTIVRVLRKNYPHHVRPRDELQTFTKFVLTVAEYMTSDGDRTRLIDRVVEKMAVVDAYVPEGVPLEVQVGNTAESPDVDMKDNNQEIEIDPTLQKMDGLLHETYDFLCRVSRSESSEMFPRIFEAFVHAHKTRIVPMHRARYVAFSTFFAANFAGREPLKWLVENLRQSFFDESLSKASRVSFVQHSAAMICRSRNYQAPETLAWVKSLVWWLHSYLDFVEMRRGKRITPDADQHRLFYGAMAAVMYVVSFRKEALCTSQEYKGNAIARMRILRLLRSRLNPLRMLPKSLVQSFADALQEMGEVDPGDVLRSSLKQTIPTKTCFDNLNYVEPMFPLDPPELPTCNELLQQFYRKFEEGSAGEDVQKEDVEENATLLDYKGKMVLV